MAPPACQGLSRPPGGAWAGAAAARASTAIVLIHHRVWVIRRPPFPFRLRSRTGGDDSRGDPPCHPQPALGAAPAVGHNRPIPPVPRGPPMAAPGPPTDNL